MKHLQPLTIPGFNGRWNRGSENITPPDHFIDELNLRFLENGVRTREGTEVYQEAEGNWDGTVRRVYSFSKPGEVDRLIILDNNGKLWDESVGFTSPILTVAGMTDFNCAVVNNRLYITPSNGLVGLANEKVYVYDGSGTARAAAGTAPTGFTLTAAATGTGTVLKGKRLFQVVYETASGYYTKPGPTAACLYEAADSVHKVTLSNIPARPVGVSAVLVIATQVIDDYSGNKLEYEHFFVPNARLTADETSLEMDFYDSDLIDSADYLNWQLETIPAGVGISVCDNRLVVCGENANPHLARVSKPGEPESVSSIAGYVETPNDGSGTVKAAAAYRGQLFFYKSRRHYTTSPSDNDPNTWVLIPVDASFGAESHGVFKVIDINDSNEEVLLTVDRTGIRRFNGNYQDIELTFKIRDLWDRINTDYFHMIQAVIDPDSMCIYCTIPLDAATSPDYLLMGDYSNGNEYDKVKWSLWQLPRASTTLAMITNVYSIPELYVGSVAGGVVRFKSTLLIDEVTSGAYTAITSFGQTAFVGDDDGNLSLFGGLRALVRGSGNLDFTVYTLDRVSSEVLQTSVLSATPGAVVTKHCNTISERASFKLGVDAANEWFVLNSLTILSKQYGSMRPM